MARKEGKQQQAETGAVVVSQAAAPTPPTEKKIAIVGCSDTKHFAPHNDPSWEMWGMNNAYNHIPRRTGWFEIHPIKFKDGKYFRRKLIRPGVFEWSNEFRGQPMEKYIQDLSGLDVPVYMQQHWDAIPKSVPYPLQDILSRFGNYFTNSVSYMIALAIMQGATEIGCYGVDMATGSEYGPQRPSCEYFLGIAVGLGIKITIPKQMDLLKTKFLYGFGEVEAQAWESKLMMMLEAMDARQAKAINQMEIAKKQNDQYIGAKEALKEIQRIWANFNESKIWNDPY
jgi:hypothetical protein